MPLAGRSSSSRRRARRRQAPRARRAQRGSDHRRAAAAAPRACGQAGWRGCARWRTGRVVQGPCGSPRCLQSPCPRVAGASDRIYTSGVGGAVIPGPGAAFARANPVASPQRANPRPPRRESHCLGAGSRAVRRELCARPRPDLEGKEVVRSPHYLLWRSRLLAEMPGSWRPLSPESLPPLCPAFPCSVATHESEADSWSPNFVLPCFE